MVHLTACGWLARTSIIYKIQAYSQPTTPKQLQTQALVVLAQVQICKLDMASYPEGFGWGLLQWQNNKSTLGLLVPAMEGGRAMIQCDGPTAICHLQCSTIGRRSYKRPTRVVEQCRKPLFWSRTAVCNIQDPHGHQSRPRNPLYRP